MIGPGDGKSSSADPVRGQCGRLATLQDRANEFRREEGEGQHLAEIFNRDAVASGDGGKVIAVAERRAPLFCPRYIGDQNIVSDGLRGADDQTSFNATTALPDRELQRQC